MNPRVRYPALPLLRFLSLMAMHLVLAGQYRLAAWIQPAWLAYAFMGLAMAVCSAPWWMSRMDDRGPHGPAGLPNAGGGAAGRRGALAAGVVLAVFMGAGLAARWLWIRRLPIDPRLGDMLPQIQQGIRDLLSGEFPYRVHYFPWPIHLPYPPALWEAYLPAEMAGLDLRYTTLACLAVLGAVWFLQFKTLAARRGAGVCLWAWVALAGAFFLSPLVLRFVIHGHTAPYWLVLAVLPLMLHVRRPGMAAVLLGVACAMRQPAILLAPILGWHWMRTQSRKKAAAWVGLAAATSLLIYLPFVARDAVAVWWTPMRQYATVGRETFAFNPPMVRETIGFSNLFYLAGWDRLLSPAAVAVFAAIFALNARRMDTAADATRAMALASLGFALLSPIPFYYEYFPALVLFMQAWWMDAASPAVPEPAPLSGRVP